MPEPVALSIGPWVRFDRYVVREGMIRPAFGARLHSYDPCAEHEMGRSTSGAQQPPYGALLDLIQSVELKPRPGPGPLVTLTPESETLVCDWCAAHGLLGVLLHRVQTVILAARWHPLPGTEHRLIPVQQQLVRTNQGWIRTGREGRRFPSKVSGDESGAQGALVPPANLPKRWSEPNVLLQDLRTGERKTESLSQTWSRFFPEVPDEEREIHPYPLPGSAAFWLIYGEPVSDFLEAATLLLAPLRALCGHEETISDEELAATQRAVDGFNRLLGPVSPAAFIGDGRLQQQWNTASLLGAFAMMALMDLTEKRRPRICSNCSKLFVTKAHQGTYCSDTCRNTAQKRRHRQRLREKSDSG